MRNQAVKPDVPSILVIYGFSLPLSNFSNNWSGGWEASNKHSLLSIPPLNRYTPDQALRNSSVMSEFSYFFVTTFHVFNALVDENFSKYQQLVAAHQSLCK